MKDRAARGIFLLGFMGSGKSTLGQMLGARLDRPFADLDERIERQAGSSIAEIFRKQGEPAFRAIETRELIELLSEMQTTPGAVVALGGGTFAQPGNRQLLETFGGLTVFLDCPLEELEHRCRDYTHQPHQPHRPLAQDLNAFRALYQERQASYRLADVTVDAGRSPEVITESILGMLT